VEGPADPGVEPGVLPVLAGQDARPDQPARAVRGVSALRALPQGARREDRARCRAPLPARARVHRPAHNRCRHGRAQGLAPVLLPGPRRPDPDRRGHPRPGRGRRRDHRARHPHRHG
jgi:hypothetical protein